MKRNEKKLSEIKEQLTTAYYNMPNEFMLQRSKSLLLQTIRSIEEVEAKRIKRHKVEEMNNIQKNIVYFSSLNDAQQAIKTLDEMLQKEQKKIDEIDSGPPGILNE